jgi:hypothetical protein
MFALLALPAAAHLQTPITVATMSDLIARLKRGAESLGFVRSELPPSVSSMQEAIRTLVEQLVVEHRLGAEHADSTAAALIRREDLGSTYLGNGLAVPHAANPSVERVIGVFAESRTGVPWDSAGDANAHFVCLVLNPPPRPGEPSRIWERLLWERG